MLLGGDSIVGTGLTTGYMACYSVNFTFGFIIGRVYVFRTKFKNPSF